MVVRFFMLQTHYRSTLDFSNEALKASEIAFKRLWNSYESLQKLDEQLTATSTGEKDSYVLEQLANIDECMNDDFNTAKVLAVLFELNALINSVKDGVQQLSVISKEVLIQLKKYYTNYLEHIFGLQAADNAIGDNRLDAAMQILINLRKAAKANKDYATSDAIRNQLAVSGIMLKDEKGGEMSWE
jgi:cysteinyl-tRNA synthetase